MTLTDTRMMLDEVSKRCTRSLSGICWTGIVNCIGCMRCVEVAMRNTSHCWTSLSSFMRSTGDSSVACFGSRLFGSHGNTHDQADRFPKQTYLASERPKRPRNAHAVGIPWAFGSRECWRALRLPPGKAASRTHSVRPRLLMDAAVASRPAHALHVFSSYFSFSLSLSLYLFRSLSLSLSLFMSTLLPISPIGGQPLKPTPYFIIHAVVHRCTSLWSSL